MNKQRAFTLIEILIAMTILSMILSMVYTILISTISARQFIQDDTYLDRTSEKILNLIIRDIQAAYIYQLEGVCFLGKSSSRLDFVTNTDSLLGSEEIKSDVCEVGYYIKKNDDNIGGYRLIRREDFFVDDNLMDGGFHIKICDKIAYFNVEYIDDKGKVKKTWNSKEDQGLPRGVFVKIGFPIAPKNFSTEFSTENIKYYRAYISVIVSSKPPIPVQPDEKKNK